MKTRINCAYKNICCGNNCRNCELRNVPYDKHIAYQLKIDARREKLLEEDRAALAKEVMKKKSIQ